MLIRHADPAPSGPVGRARRRFWVLIALAVLAGGAMSTALTATPGSLAGLGVALNGLVLIGSLAGAARIMLALERARQRAREGSAR